MKIARYLTLLIAIVSSASVLTQTEQEYFEKLRLERKDKKIKTISVYDNLKVIKYKKEYYDENGYLIKKELFYHDNEKNKTYLYQEIKITSYDALGNISGKEILYELGKRINEFQFSNINFTYFYEIGFSENLIDDIKYLFDDNGNLIEKRFTSADMYEPGKYEKETFLYDSNNKLVESKYSYPDNNSSHVRRYHYSSTGLLEMESYLDDNLVQTEGVKYEYEFY